LHSHTEVLVQFACQGIGEVLVVLELFAAEIPLCVHAVNVSTTVSRLSVQDPQENGCCGNQSDQREDPCSDSEQASCLLAHVTTQIDVLASGEARCAGACSLCAEWILSKRILRNCTTLALSIMALCSAHMHSHNCMEKICTKFELRTYK